MMEEKLRKKRKARVAQADCVACGCCVKVCPRGVVLFHAETGSMVMLVDGSTDDFTSIGQLDASDWFVVGAGDYNGDQHDDLLVRQYSTGMLGYYASGDTTQWNVLGYGVGMEWTVIA